MIRDHNTPYTMTAGLGMAPNIPPAWVRDMVKDGTRHPGPEQWEGGRGMPIRTPGFHLDSYIHDPIRQWDIASQVNLATAVRRM